MFTEYSKWLIESKNLGAKSAHDYASRLRRAAQLLDCEEFNFDSLDRLNTIEEFTRLSMSVKSQIRRAVRLYLEFQERR